MAASRPRDVEPAAVAEAWRQAERFAQSRDGCEVFVGSGDSMLPLYAERTVLVVQRVPMTDLRGGMTVVFTGDQGWPVAHLLVERTPRGWRARGLGNDAPDRTLVRRDNLVGVVIQAFAPVPRGSEPSVEALVAGETDYPLAIGAATTADN